MGKILDTSRPSISFRWTVVYVTFPKDKCNWYFPSRQILSLEYHRLYFHVRAAIFLDLWGCIFGVFNNQIDYSTNLCFINLMVVALWNRPQEDAVCLASRDPSQASCSRCPNCECFKEPSINVLKTRFDWNSIYWQLLGNANLGQFPWTMKRSTHVTHCNTFYLLTLNSHPKSLWHLIRVMRKHDLTNILTIVTIWTMFDIFYNFLQFWQFLHF